MINKADRLFVEVSMDEARRALETARKDLDVAQSALKALIRIDSAVDVRPSPRFSTTIRAVSGTVQGSGRDNSYALNQLGLQSDAAENELRMSRTGYAPEIALFGKHTLYSHGIRKNLLPRTVVGAGFTWTLFDGLAREKKIAQAKIARQTLGLSSSQAEDDIDVGVDKLCAQISNALSSVAALGTTIDLSRELVRMRRKASPRGGYVDRGRRCRGDALQGTDRRVAGLLRIRRGAGQSAVALRRARALRALQPLRTDRVASFRS